MYHSQAGIMILGRSYVLSLLNFNICRYNNILIVSHSFKREPKLIKWNIHLYMICSKKMSKWQMALSISRTFMQWMAKSDWWNGYAIFIGHNWLFYKWNTIYTLQHKKCSYLSTTTLNTSPLLRVESTLQFWQDSLSAFPLDGPGWYLISKSRSLSLSIHRARPPLEGSLRFKNWSTLSSITTVNLC